MHKHKIIVGDLEFPMKIKDIPKFEKHSNLNTNVLELNKTVFTRCAVTQQMVKHGNRF